MAHVHDEPVGNNKHRRILCLREGARDDMAKCPLCARGDKFFAKVYLKLIEYVKDEKGNIVAQAKVWERPESFADTIVEYINAYGGLKDVVFKIKRKGIRGNTDTNYILTPMPSTLYGEANGYVKDFSEFDNFSFFPHSFLSKSKEDMEEYIKTGDFPFRKKDGTVVTKEEATQEATVATSQPSAGEPTLVASSQPVELVQEAPVAPTAPMSGVATSSTIPTTNTQSADTNNPLMDRPRRRYDYK